MALPMLTCLRDHYQVLPITQLQHKALVELLQADDILEPDLPVVSNLRFRSNPRGSWQVLRQLNDLKPSVTLLYGKTLFAAASLTGASRSGLTLYSSLNRRRQQASSEAYRNRGRGLGRLTCLDSSGNQVEDHWRFIDYLKHERRDHRWRLTPEARERLRRTIPGDFQDTRYVVVAPWTSDKRRDAHLDYFRRVVECVTGDLGLTVLITGQANHADQVHRLTSGLPRERIVNLTGKTSLADLLGLLAGARFVVANDSGNMHLAVLLGTPSVVLFTSTSPDMLVSRQWNESVSAVQFPLTRSGHAATIPGGLRKSLLEVTIPEALQNTWR